MCLPVYLCTCIRRANMNPEYTPCNTKGTILIPGSGPIVIGQAAEFDYSGTQAVKALRAEGYRIVLVNSNPATIMTDPEIADATYMSRSYRMRSKQSSRRNGLILCFPLSAGRRG
ncbi:MAG TPA: hypothetical protein VI451_19810 [Anaerolineales bacterium]|nr:hypothetical protein [Anaerolineales bacterium]